MKTSATNTRDENFPHAPEESATLRSPRSHRCPVLAGADVWTMGHGPALYSQGGALWLRELRSHFAT